MSKGKQNLDLLPEIYIKIFKALPSPTYLWKKVGEELILIDYNDYADRLVNGKMEQFLGINAAELYKDNLQIWEDLNRCITSKITFSKEIKYEYKTKNMEKDLRAGYIFIQPDIVLIHTDDITDKKKAEVKLEESEKRYRLISENSGAVVWVADMNLNLTYVSPSTPKILGYSVEESMKFPIRNRVTLESIKIMAEILKEELKLEKVKEIDLNRSRTFETNQIHKNGSIIPVEVTITFLRDNNGKATGILGVSRDITERKKAERHLQKSEENYRNAFERANFYKDLFVHDISNVFSSLLSSLELCNMYLDDPSNRSQIKELQQIQKAAVLRGTNLIAKVRKLDEIDNIEILTQPINSCEILKKSIKYVKESFSMKNIKFTFQTMTQELIVDANELLEDIFENILINAVKYNESTLIRIQIKISSPQINQKKYIKMEFLDNGIGISDDRKNYIFQSGFKDKKGTKGLGFGLSLVKKILDKYGGFISIENRIKEDYTKGSNFIILLPAFNQDN